MAVKEEFEIIVTPNGEIKVVAIGFKGATCLKSIKAVGDIVSPGNPPVHEEKLSEFYQQTEEKGTIKGETGDK